MNKEKPRVLGIAASLRNARWGIGNRYLIESLKAIPDEKELSLFLTRESELHLENFLEAGRREGKSFLEIYTNLKNNKGDRGLSNSEVALAAALWAAYRKGVDIDHLSLGEYFSVRGEGRRLEELKQKLAEAEGILISGPVYFGDRGSLAHSLIDLIRKNEELRSRLRGKVYGGIAVGAKRNGGQETTLIYQMLDLVSLGLLAVGNDSETTSQYGGTGHAGDVGTMHKDSYGLNTSMGTGRRLASIVRKMSNGRELEGSVRILFLILQDARGIARKEIGRLLSQCGDGVMPTIIDIANKQVMRCLACDICPTHIDTDEVYRCIITSEQDDMGFLHQELLYHDAIIPVTVSVGDAASIRSNYQTFIERTRYLRRGDYIFSDILTAPLTFEEIGVQEHYSIRMLTSMIRHHTVMAKPMAAYLSEGVWLNRAQIQEQFRKFVAATRHLTAARLSEADREESVKYNPVGYVLSAQKDLEDEKLKKRKQMVDHRQEHLRREARTRLKSSPQETFVS